MKVRFFDPGKSYVKIKSEIDAAMQDVLTRGDLILRKDVEEFEANLANYVGTKYAVGVASGTDALILSLKAAGIQPGDKVLVPSYSFRATVEAVVHAGGIPVTYDLDFKVDIDEKIKFIIPAYIAGEVQYLHFPPGLTVIEDACQAIGAAPVRGLTACYSFYPAKLLGCYGDAGAIATNDKDLYEKLKILRNHNKGDWHEVGYNSRLDNLQAAVLNVKLKYLPEAIQRRESIALKYNTKLFPNSGIKWAQHRKVYQDYIIELESEEKRNALKAFLAEQGIETMENGYPYPDLAPKGPLTLSYESRSLRIPCNENLTDEEVQYVIEKINEYAKSM